MALIKYPERNVEIKENPMKKNQWLSVFAMLTVLTIACVPQVSTVPLQQPFDKAQADRLLRPGNNTIKVNAFLRQAGGGVVTCAGEEVGLVPATEMAKERITALYGSVNGGYRDIHAGNIKFENADPAYIVTQKTALCSSDGRVIFEKVTNGDFYIVTRVIWMVQVAQGGTLAKLISVKGGETKDVVLSN